MEFLLVFALIAVIMLCIGFGLGDVLMMALLIIAALTALIGVFFVFCLALLIFSKKKSGVFVEFNDEGRFPCAVYDIDGRSVKNLFPCEMIMRDRLYIPGKEIKLLYFKPRGFAFDRNALLTIIIGSMVFIPGGVFSLSVLAGWISSML